MRAILILTSLLALTLPTAVRPAAAQAPGVYEVTGTNLDGTPYSGLAQIQTTGLASFSIRWRIGGNLIDGLGFASGRTVAVTYGLATRPGIAIYTLNPDGSMDGEWTIVGSPRNGSERLVPRRGAEAAPAPAANPTEGAAAPPR
jgi:hypothetical protein